MPDTLQEKTAQFEHRDNIEPVCTGTQRKVGKRQQGYSSLNRQLMSGHQLAVAYRKFSKPKEKEG